MYLHHLLKAFLIPLGFTAAASGIDAPYQKKIYESGMITLITSNKEIKDNYENSYISWRIWFINK